jgi:hypothetical protein
MNYRRNELYVDNEVRFYITLRRKELVKGVKNPGGITEDEVVNADLRNLYTNEHPEWVLAWDKREKARQKHKKDLERIENEAIGLVPELEVNHTT